MLLVADVDVLRRRLPLPPQQVEGGDGAEPRQEEHEQRREDGGGRGTLSRPVLQSRSPQTARVKLLQGRAWTVLTARVRK
eukprot:SAG11_NODE_2701_length_3076_cov_5.049043_5_plen_80_part_00